jgi:hypothetical protein
MYLRLLGYLKLRFLKTWEYPVKCIVKFLLKKPLHDDGQMAAGLISQRVKYWIYSEITCLKENHSNDLLCFGKGSSLKLQLTLGLRNFVLVNIKTYEVSTPSPHINMYIM